MYLFHFIHLFFTIYMLLLTPYPRSVSGSQIWLVEFNGVGFDRRLEMSSSLSIHLPNFRTEHISLQQPVKQNHIHHIHDHPSYQASVKRQPMNGLLHLQHSDWEVPQGGDPDRQKG